MVTNVIQWAHDLRRVAEAGPIGQRKTSFELYQLLSGCLGLAEQCASDPAKLEQMRGLVTQQPANGNRRYVERGADAYQCVCRFVFHNLKSEKAERSNASRYAICLREAAKRGVKAAALPAWLKENGGLNSLFLARPLAARSVTTRTLYLTAPVELPKYGAATLTLRRQADGRFQVLEYACEE